MSGHDYDPYDTNHDGKLDFNERCAKEIDEEAIFREMQDAHKKIDQRNSAFANKNMSDPSHRPHHVGTGQLAEKSETQRRIEEVRRESVILSSPAVGMTAGCYRFECYFIRDNGADPSGDNSRGQ